MEITDEKLLEEYKFHYDQTNVNFNLKNYKNAMEHALQCWNIIPNPKELYSESYYIAKKLFRYSYLLDDLNNAKNWSKTLLSCDLERLEDGEREFFYGKVNYDLDNLDVAKEYLNIANKKSKGRCFIDEDKKYKLFIK